MAKRVARFEKVTYRQFEKDWIDAFNVPELNMSTRRNIKDIYDAITLPKRATKGSAGYDFVSPLTFTLKPGETIKIPTGCKYGLNLMNQTGIVDSDFYYSDNEGHIFVKLKNNGDKECTIREGDNVVQGVFLEYGITIDDEAAGVRNGGFGSTTENK